MSEGFRIRTRATFWATPAQMLTSPRLNPLNAEILEGGIYFFLADPDLALGETWDARIPCAWAWAGSSAGGFPYRLTVEGEFVPVDLSALVNRHCCLLLVNKQKGG